MTAFIPPTMHEEIDFLEEVEREMMALTTAELEGIASDSGAATPASFAKFRTVIPAEAGTHNPHENSDENSVATMPRGYGVAPNGATPSRG